MDAEEISIDVKCENLMNIVVESRKRFRKMCNDYEQKISLMENKTLNFQIETFTNYKFKPKNPIPVFENEDTEDMENFNAELLKRSKRIEDIRQRVKNTQEVVVQLKGDRLGQRLREPITANAMLTKAKSSTS